MCPTGTVPIRRTTKADLIRAKSLRYNHTLIQDDLVGHVAQVSLKNIPGSPYYGVSGTNSIWNPRVSNSQTSSSYFMVQNGEGTGVANKISIGWHVSPPLYGNTATYSYWTSDNSKSTGCYNTLCKGFVQTNKAYIIGVRFEETSVYGGSMYEIKVDILQDRQTKNWLVNIEDQTIGYFPAALFNNFDNGAAQVGWGGRTMTPAGTPTPPMGSGYLPDDTFDHSCYFRQISYRDKVLSITVPTTDVLETFTDAPKCYGAENYDSSDKKLFGYNVHIGGPGGVC